jgi:hypothetical protein
MIEICNRLPGATPVKKFTDPKKAVARIWKSVQSLVPAPEVKPVELPTAVKKAHKVPKATDAPKPAKVAKEKVVKFTRAKKVDEPPHSATVARKPASWRSSNKRGRDPR